MTPETKQILQEHKEKLERIFGPAVDREELQREIEQLNGDVVGQVVKIELVEQEG